MVGTPNNRVWSERRVTTLDYVRLCGYMLTLSMYVGKATALLHCLARCPGQAPLRNDCILFCRRAAARRLSEAP